MAPAQPAVAPIVTQPLGLRLGAVLRIAPDLVLQMPRELYQPELAELPVSLRQPQDLLPPSSSPLLGDDNACGFARVLFHWY